MMRTSGEIMRVKFSWNGARPACHVVEGVRDGEPLGQQFAHHHGQQGRDEHREDAG